MDMITSLKQILNAHGITKYDDDTTKLEAFILEAKLLIGEPFVFDQQYQDYLQTWRGDCYVTDHYPLLGTGLQVCVGGVDITEHVAKVTDEGIIYLDGTYSGALQVTYTVGLTSDDITNYLIPIVMHIVLDKEGYNVQSITEGDVSVTYNNSTGNTSNTIDALIGNLKEKYTARVCLL